MCQRSLSRFPAGRRRCPGRRRRRSDYFLLCWLGRSREGAEQNARIGTPTAWREAARAAGKGADLDAVRAIDPDLVEKESVLLASALRQVMEQLPEGGRALVVGHSPTSEAAALGLSGRVVPPLGKGRGVLLIEDGGDYRVEPLDLNGGERFPPATRCFSASLGLRVLEWVRVTISAGGGDRGCPCRTALAG
jgi:hypothetical protein